MIYDQIQNAERYYACHPNIEAALRYIRQHRDDPSLEDGKFVIQPDTFIVNVVSGKTRNRGDARMECHERFMDVQYILEGEEICAIAPAEPSVAVDPESDTGFWDCEDSGCIRVRQGEFYIVWPGEPHCPMVSTGAVAPIRKIICKVRVD